MQRKKTLIIVHTGEWRFSTEATQSLIEKVLIPLGYFFDFYLIGVFWEINSSKSLDELSQYKKILAPHFKMLDLQFVSENALHNPNPFEKIRHPDKDRYCRIFSLLYLAMEAISSLEFTPDRILRTRSDIIYLNQLVIPKREKDHALYVPVIEGHEDVPYDPRYVCNVQIAYGNLNAMSLYLNLINCASDEIESFERLSPTGKSDHGIEGILLNFLKKRSLEIYNLNVLYKIKGKSPQPLKDLYNLYFPRFIFDGRPNRVRFYIFKYIKKLIRLFQNK